MNRIRKIATLAVLGLIAGTPTAGADELASMHGLTLDGARKVIAGAMAYAKQNQTTGVVAVVDRGGNVVAVERLDGTLPSGANISIGKARTAALFRKPTSVFEKIVDEGRPAVIALPDFTLLQGGVPIEVDGQIVGAVGVSGAKSAAQDEELATAGAKAIAPAK